MSSNGLPTITESDNPLPPKVMGYISVRGKESVFKPGVRQLHKTAKAYHGPWPTARAWPRT
jgi:hypothetical protein